MTEPLRLPHFLEQRYSNIFVRVPSDAISL
jgi:hypothetical protein